MLNREETEVLKNVFSEADVDYQKFEKLKKMSRDIKRICYILCELNYGHESIARMLNMYSTNVRVILDKERHEDRKEAQELVKSLKAKNISLEKHRVDKKDLDIIRQVMDYYYIVDYEFYNRNTEKATKARKIVCSIFKEIGYTNKKIAYILNIDESHIGKNIRIVRESKELRKDLYENLTKSGVVPCKMADIKNFYNDGKTPEEMSKKLDVSIEEINKMIARLGDVFEEYRIPDYKTGKMNIKYV